MDEVIPGFCLFEFLARRLIIRDFSEYEVMVFVVVDNVQGLEGVARELLVTLSAMCSLSCHWQGTEGLRQLFHSTPASLRLQASSCHE